MEICFFCKSFYAADKFLEKTCCPICKKTLEINKSFADLQEQIKDGFRTVEKEIGGIT